MPQLSRFPWLGSSLQRAVLLFSLMAAVILGVYYILSTENARRLARPTVVGWDDLEECGSLTSFDGTKTIDFERDNKVTLTENSSEEDDESEGKSDESARKTSGTWSFDEEKERYTVNLKETLLDYMLVKPEDSNVCIFAPGDVDAVNLRESWFGRIEEE
jgi:hypothetical protein